MFVDERPLGGDLGGKMMGQKRSDRDGPSILSIDPWVAGNATKGRTHQLLSDEERAQLATIASVVRFRKGEEIYGNGEQAIAIFNIISGVVKIYSGDDPSHIATFLFPGDLFGLSEEGIYINSAKAVTPVTAYQLPVQALRGRLSKDAVLEYHMICKLCQGLRHSQRHAFLVAQRHADSKIATFLQMLEQLQAARGEEIDEIHVPMDRSDIGEYVGMSLAAVSRTFGSLISRGVLKSRDRRHVRIADRRAFETIIAGSIVRRSGRRPAKARGQSRTI
jgi:CRP-like cAMP-binding protein